MAGRNEIMVQRAVYQIGVVTLLSALIWVGIGIYQASRQGAEVGVDKELLTPFNPTIDQATIEKLGTRIKTGQLPSPSVTIVEEAPIIDQEVNNELAN